MRPACSSVIATGRRGSPASSRRHEMLDHPDRLTGMHVLLAEDDPDTREVFAAFLESEGLRVTCVPSGNQAWRAFSENRPDVVLSDIEMPDGDGFSLVRRIRALDGESGGLTPAISVSGTAEWQRAVMEGFHVSLRKPVDPMELVRTIHEFAHPGLPEPGDRAIVLVPRPGVLVLRFDGHVRRPDMEAAMKVVVEQLAQGPCVVVSDLRALASFSPSVANVAQRSVWRLRGHISTLYLLGGSVAARVISQGAAKVLGLRVELVNELPPEATLG